jgi:2,3-bisphosphoglycerate-independent phosphoglycerate mutase
MVPLYVVGPKRLKLNPDGGALCDIAPTLLELLGQIQPEEMTGRSLLEEKP